MTHLKSCWKRAERFGGCGAVQKGHPLEAAYRNCMLLADVRHDKHGDRDYLATIIALDRFARAIDQYAKTNMLEGDRSIAKMLRSWKRRMPFNPTLLA